MVVTRSMSGTTKKADPKVAVNHKFAERASKKTSAERARKKLAWLEKARMNERQLRQKAADLYVEETFMPQYRNKHPSTKTTLDLKVVWSGYEEWNSLTDSDKDPYVAKAKKIEDEQIAAIEHFIMNRHLH